MRDCEIKSTGFLVDELITLDLKIAAGNEEARERRHELANTIVERTARLVKDADLMKYREFQRTMAELIEVQERCWNAQEIFRYLPTTDECTLYQIYEKARAGEEAQETNARRNRLVRKLDGIMNETARTQLEKTYDKER